MYFVIEIGEIVGWPVCAVLFVVSACEIGGRSAAARLKLEARAAMVRTVLVNMSSSFGAEWFVLPIFRDHRHAGKAP